MDVELNSRTTAVGLARFAKEYLEAAIVVDREMGKEKAYPRISPMPAYFLLTHGIELTLKAYLRHTGMFVKELQKVGHDLQSLHTTACELGLQDLHKLSASDAEAFSLLAAANEFHQLRYIQTGFKRFPEWSQAEHLAVRLHQAIAPKVGYKSFSLA